MVLRVSTITVRLKDAGRYIFPEIVVKCVGLSQMIQQLVRDSNHATFQQPITHARTRTHVMLISNDMSYLSIDQWYVSNNDELPQII